MQTKNILNLKNLYFFSACKIVYYFIDINKMPLKSNGYACKVKKLNVTTLGLLLLSIFANPTISFSLVN